MGRRWRGTDGDRRPSREPARPSARVVLGRALGPTGLLIAGLSVLMLAFSLFVLKRDYDRLEQARVTC